MLNDGDYITKDTMIALGESRYNQFKTSVGADMGYGRYRDVISSPDLAGVYVDDGGDFWSFYSVEDVVSFYKSTREIALDEILFHLL